MKKVIVVSLLSVLVSFSAISQSAYNTKRVQLNGNAAIYLVFEGVKKQIPNQDCYNRLFKDWNGIVKLDQASFNSIPSGTAFSAAATLSIRPSDGAVFLIDNGKKYHISSAELMDSYYFNWNTARNTVWSSSYDQYLDAIVEDEGEADEEGSENY